MACWAPCTRLATVELAPLQRGTPPKIRKNVYRTPQVCSVFAEDRRCTETATRDGTASVTRIEQPTSDDAPSWVPRNNTHPFSNSFTSTPSLEEFHSADGSSNAAEIHVQGACPSHVSIILDGNQRWADSNGLQPWEGHQAGVRSLHAIVRACARVNVSTLSVFGFSAENWNRSVDEVSWLFKLMEVTLQNDLEELHNNGVQLHFFGDLDSLPLSLQQSMSRAEEITKNNTGLTLGVALSYGGKQDVVQAVKHIAQLSADGKLAPGDVNEDLIASFLQTNSVCCNLGPPDLLIRTSGEMRLSNFMLWDLAYTELYFSPKFWPDFEMEDFLIAIDEYSRRQRRYGRRSAG